MAMTNAERQKKFRQQRSNQVSELEALRNENIKLRSDIELLLKEIDSLKYSKAKKSSSINLDSESWDPTGLDPSLFDLDVPMLYHPVIDCNPQRDFSRTASDVWLLSKGQTNWKECYRIILQRKSSKKPASFELHAPASTGINNSLFTAATWESVVTQIADMGL